MGFFDFLIHLLWILVVLAVIMVAYDLIKTKMTKGDS